MYLFKSYKGKGKAKVQMLGSGAILREVIKAAETLSKDYGIDCNVWSCLLYTSPSPRDS